LPERAIVAIRYAGRSIGLYRVKQVGELGLLLNHGGISFPVGTRLDIEDIQHLMPRASANPLPATVVDNTADGLRLMWCRNRKATAPWEA
jgi:hypothetical protein